MGTFHFSTVAWNSYADQAGLKFTEIQMPVSQLLVLKCEPPNSMTVESSGHLEHLGSTIGYKWGWEGMCNQGLLVQKL